FLALGAGGIGIFLPILPTTPFVMVAAGCFGASSPRLAEKLENTKIFGEYVRNYRNKTGISKKSRYVGIACLWATLVISGAVVHKPKMLIVLAVVGVAVTIHILMLRKAKENIQ
ncbi:MAG: YbaN family protein, partial [Oscillospiraceae bacterium]|nr:YbaN family protein [Oscillospiraceae bacterium]